MVDLEILQEKDEGQAYERLKERDRSFFLSLSPEIQKASDRATVLRRWVEFRRREQDFPTPSPGESTMKLIADFRTWGSVLALALGMGYAWGILNITGQRVNVTWFWFLTILLPGLVTLLGFYSLLSGRIPGTGRMTGSLVWRFVSDRVGTFLSGAQAQEWKKRQGTLRKKLYGHGHLVGGVLSSLAHSLGLCFSIGIFVMIVLFRSFSDQNYGWQTHSGWLDEVRMQNITRVIATPWQSFAPENVGHPSLTSVEESRIFRDQITEHSNPATNVAWSGFLLWSALFYGCVPRFLLFIAGRLSLRRALRREDGKKHDLLWRRMTVPEIESKPETTQSNPAPTDLPETLTRIDANGDELPHAPSDIAVLLIPPDTDSAIPGDTLIRLLQSRDMIFGEKLPLPALPSERNKLRAALENAAPSRLIIARNSYSVPNKSFLNFVQELRQIATQPPIYIVVLHDDEIHPQDSMTWKAAIGSLGDPFVYLLEVVNP